MKKRCTWARLNSLPRVFFLCFSFSRISMAQVSWDWTDQSVAALQYRYTSVRWNFMLYRFYEHADWISPPLQSETLLPNVPPQAFYDFVCMHFSLKMLTEMLSFSCLVTLTHMLNYASVLFCASGWAVLFLCSRSNKCLSICLTTRVLHAVLIMGWQRYSRLQAQRVMLGLLGTWEGTHPLDLVEASTGI